MVVNLYNNAQVANNGMPITGYVSAHHKVLGMEIIVLQTHAQMEDGGTKLKELANAWIIKYGLMMHVFPHRLYAPTAEFGITIYMHVPAHKEHSLHPQDATQCQFAQMEKYIIH